MERMCVDNRSGMYRGGSSEGPTWLSEGPNLQLLASLPPRTGWVDWQQVDEIPWKESQEAVFTEPLNP